MYTPCFFAIFPMASVVGPGMIGYYSGPGLTDTSETSPDWERARRPVLRLVGPKAQPARKRSGKRTAYSDRLWRVASMWPTEGEQCEPWARA